MRYSGLCVGGPRAGQRMESASPLLAVAVMKPYLAGQFDQHVVAAYSTYTYRWTWGVRLPHGRLLSFWVPEAEAVGGEDAAAAWALEQLVQAYEVSHAQ